MHDVVDRSRNQRGARFLPMHDPLTNLADHDLLAEQASRMLAKASRAGRPVALLVVDVDDFAQVNAAHGMVAGDETLRFIALRLMKVVRGADMVARLGGDDYAVLMEDYSGPDEIGVVATRIVEAMHAALSVGDSKIDISVSVGIAQAPQDGRGFSQLLRAARAAQGQVKARGGNGFLLVRHGVAA
jgi:diguanylate cyclase (GGDEF)-like protein